MSIRDLTTQIKACALLWIGKWGIAVLILLVGVVAFGMGRLSGLENSRVPVTFGEAPHVAGYAALHQGGDYFASRSTHKYYFPWCADVKNIAPENFIIYKSQHEAENGGYVPAPNCKGLK